MDECRLVPFLSSADVFDIVVSRDADEMRRRHARSATSRDKTFLCSSNNDAALSARPYSAH